MAGKMINQLPTEIAWGTDHNNHVMPYQSANDDITYKIKLSDIIDTILNNHIAVMGDISKAVANHTLTLTVANSGDDAQTWYISDTQPSEANVGDLWLHTDTTYFGDIDEYSDVEGTMTWMLKANMKGADGANGSDGADGADGITPHIDSTTKHWMIGEVDTNVKAEGEDGDKGDTGYSISATTTVITGGTRVTIHSTDPNVTDISFDVMNGSAGSYVQGDGINISGNVIAFKPGSGLSVNAQTGNIDVTSSGSSATVSQTLTLTSSGWNNKSQTVSFTHDTSKRNCIDITPSEVPKWAEYGVYAVSETASGITFNCLTTPSEALTFKVTSMEVTS